MPHEDNRDEFADALQQLTFASNNVAWLKHHIQNAHFDDFRVPKDTRIRFKNVVKQIRQAERELKRALKGLKRASR